MKSKILVIDDDVLIREGIKLNLENEGYEFYTAKNGKLAIELIKKMKPDLCIIDIMLPDISGFEIIKIIKKMKRNLLKVQSSSEFNTAGTYNYDIFNNKGEKKYRVDISIIERKSDNFGKNEKKFHII